MVDILSKLTDVFPVGIAIVTAILAIILSTLLRSSLRGVLLERNQQTIYGAQVQLERRLDELNKMIEDRPEILDTAKVARLEARMNRVEQEITSLRQLLFDNPDAAITIPLLKKDIAGLQNDMKTTSSNSNGS